MGMRGTRSPGGRVRLVVEEDQVLPVPFGEIAATTMTPLCHILWSAVWIGIAEGALGRAVRFTRIAARGSVAAGDERLAEAGRRMGLLDGLLSLVIAGYQAGRTSAVDYQLEVNNLKLSASTETVRVAEAALEVCGMAGYQQTGDFSMARALRDLYSARLMVANSRLVATNATAMLVRRYE
jgi:acyl-CoA dehydrogenase